MSWQDIIKSKKNAFPKQNLQLMKRVSQEIYDSIPIGTKFLPMDYWLEFKQKIIDSEPTGQDKRNFTLWIKGQPENWFINYFTKYGKLRMLAVRSGEKFERI